MERLQLVLHVALLVLLVFNCIISTSLYLKLSNQSVEKDKFYITSNDLRNYRSDCKKPLENYDGVFIYSPSCPFSKRMIPLIEKSNLSWYWVNIVDNNCLSLNLSRFDYRGYVPHFYCFRTNSSHTGSLPEDRFNQWVNQHC